METETLADDADDALREIIAARAPLSFRDYMALALYHPEHGYYASGRAAIGRGGDYFTSVSVGAVFGQLLGVQFAEMWEGLGRPAEFSIIEQGANDGMFAADVLGWARKFAPGFFAAVRYGIVEGVPGLREVQAGRLDAFSNVAWYESVEGLPRFTGVHFSNELVDAFPAHLVRYADGAWRELYVTASFKWTSEAISEPALLEQVRDLPQVEGYTTEVNLEAVAWAGALAGKLERGWVLAIDYGYPRALYYAPERTRGTLECYAGHRKGLDPLGEPGRRDLTAHVEFTSLARAFEEGGLTVGAFTDQHRFLTPLTAKAFANQPPTAKEARMLKMLLHPEMLGTSFKVLAVARGVSSEGLTGFRFNRAGDLGEDFTM